MAVLPSGFFTLHRPWIVELAAKSRLPALYQKWDYVDMGGLMAYGPMGAAVAAVSSPSRQTITCQPLRRLGGYEPPRLPGAPLDELGAGPALL